MAKPRVTRGEGALVVRIDAPGFCRLHTIAMEPHPDSTAADWRSHGASLTFLL